MRFLKFLGKLLGDVWGFAWENKAWWIIPLVLIFLAMAALIFLSSSVAPLIYTFF